MSKASLRLIRVLALLLAALVVASGCSSSDAIPSTVGFEELAANDPKDKSSIAFLCPDPSMTCNSKCAKTGYPCETDCRTTCGFGSMGTKNCTCTGGLYVQCPCPKPPRYTGAPTAPYCDSLTENGLGRALDLNELPCSTLFQECIGRESADGTPKGCSCVPSSANWNDPNWVPDPNAPKEWDCASTNKWFTLAPGLY